MSKCNSGRHNFEHPDTSCDDLDRHLLRADHVNLQDGIAFDVDGIPSGVREDTKIPIKPFNPLDAPEEIPLPADFNDDPGVDTKTVEFWRNAQRRAPKDD